MLNHTKKIKEIYEEIQRKIFRMIPEKWEKLYLYCSFIDENEKKEKGELYFYYIPKGIFKKNPVNVYEIPNKFNLEENQYLKLVENLYKNIKELREEFKKTDIINEIWTNITISIENAKFKVEYKYDNLKSDEISNYERHIIWRYKFLNIGPEQVGKEEKEILKKYIYGAKQIEKTETYETGIYIREEENIIEYNKEEGKENIDKTRSNIKTNQILISKINDKKNSN